MKGKDSERKRFERIKGIVEEKCQKKKKGK
jgi:hypothetical protein